MSIYDFTLMLIGLAWIYLVSIVKAANKGESIMKKILFVTSFYTFMYALVNSGVIKIG